MFSLLDEDRRQFQRAVPALLVHWVLVVADQYPVEVVQLVLDHPRPEPRRAEAPQPTLQVVTDDPDMLSFSDPRVFEFPLRNTNYGLMLKTTEES